jgi:hypothetical protein
MRGFALGLPGSMGSPSTCRRDGSAAFRNLIAGGELVGVALLAVIGVALIALVPAKQTADGASEGAARGRLPAP